VQETDVALMADLRCEAQQLKNKRFEVANVLRFRNDSLAKLDIPLTDLQKQEEDSIRQRLTLRTGEVAVRLTRTMDSLFEIHYKTVEQRQAFDVAVERKVQEMCVSE
jgi:hypothetical protein